MQTDMDKADSKLQEDTQYLLSRTNRDKIMEMTYMAQKIVARLETENEAQRAEIVGLKSRIAELEAEKN
jgi:DNA polymerase/3'-5' exonuclease PolX